MNKKIKWLPIGTLLVILGIVLLLVIFYSYTPVVDEALLRAVNSIGREKFKISYRNISGNLLKEVRLDGVILTFDDDTLHCKRIELDYSLLELAKRKFHFEEIRVSQPILILQSKNENKPSASESVSSDSVSFALPFDEFPDLKIEKLILENGTVLIKNDYTTEKFNDIRLTLVGEMNKDSVNLVLANCRGYWNYDFAGKNGELLLNNISFRLYGNPRRLVLDRFKVRNKQMTILASGQFQYQPNREISVAIDSIFVNHKGLDLFLPDFPYQNGYSYVTGALKGTSEAFSGNLYMSGVFDSLLLNRLTAKLYKKDDSIQLTEIDLTSNFGNLTGSLLAALKGENNANLTFDDVNLKKIGILNSETSISGKVNFNFKNWDIQRLSGRGKISLPSIKYRGVQFDSLRLSVAADEGNFALMEPSKVVLADESQFFLAGTFSRDQYLNVQLMTTDNDLNALFRKIGMPSFGGMGTMILQLTGPLNNPDLSGQLFLDSLLYNGVKVYSVGSQIDIKRILQNRSGHFQLEILSGNINKLKLTRGLLRFSVEKNRVYIDTVSFVSEQNNIAMQGSLSVFTDSINIELNSFRIKYEDYLIHNDQTVQINVINDTLLVSNFELMATDYGSIRLEGMWDYSHATSKIKLQVINTRLEPFNQFVNWKYHLKGVLTADVNLEGNFYNPSILSSLNISEVFLDDYFVGSLDSKITYKNQALGIEYLNYQYNDTSFVNLDGTVQLADEDTLFKDLFSPLNTMDLYLNIADIQIQDYPFLFNVNFPLEAALSSNIKLTGTIGAPQGTVHLSGSNAIIEKYKFPAFDIDGRITPSRILIDQAEINLLNTNIQAKGFKTIQWDFNNLNALFKDKSFELFCEIDEDSVNFLYALIPDVDRIIGAVQVKARFGGNVDKPRLIGGDISVSNGSLYLTKIENPIQDVDMRAQVKNQSLYIDHFEGRSPKVEIRESFFKKLLRRFFAPVRKLIFQESEKGEIEVAGNIDFSQLGKPEFNVDVSLNDAYFHYFLENARLVVNSDKLHIEGRDTIAFSGDAIIKEGEVELDIEESEKNLLLTESTRQTPPYLQYLLNVEIPDNFFIRSEAPFNTFDIEIGGNVRIIQEPAGLLEMYGELNIIKGKYFIQFEDFEITSGSIVFVNPKEYPELNLTAQKQKNNYLFDLTVSGPLNNPVKEMITTNIATNEEIHEIKDQMSLLVFGVRFEEISGLSQSAFLQKGEEVLAQTLISQFEKEARYFTGLDRIRITTQGRDESYINEFGEDADDVSTLALGKYLAPNLYLEYQTKLSYVPGLASLPKPTLAWESGNLIYLKYRITRNWSLSSFYEKTLRGNDKVRFDVNWQLDF